MKHNNHTSDCLDLESSLTLWLSDVRTHRTFRQKVFRSHAEVEKIMPFQKGLVRNGSIYPQASRRPTSRLHGLTLRRPHFNDPCASREAITASVRAAENADCLGALSTTYRATAFVDTRAASFRSSRSSTGRNS
ncbi:hypothetical protein Emed_007525 [Eimeria media]